MIDTRNIKKTNNVMSCVPVSHVNLSQKEREICYVVSYKQAKMIFVMYMCLLMKRWHIRFVIKLI